MCVCVCVCVCVLVSVFGEIICIIHAHSITHIGPYDESTQMKTEVLAAVENKKNEGPGGYHSASPADEDTSVSRAKPETGFDNAQFVWHGGGTAGASSHKI